LIDWCLTPTLAVFQQYRGVRVVWTQLKLQQKNAFQSDHIFNQATALCYALPDL
jgi:hypothetical protein